MRLIGPKEFLKTVKPGTLYERFWLDNEKECLDLIKRYEHQETLYYYSEIEMFGDNIASLGFCEVDELESKENPIEINGKTYTCLFYYDANVVGDACPKTTLYLVYDNEDEWPEKIKVEDTKDKYLTKEELITIRDWFLKSNVFENELEGWALEALETDNYYKDNFVVNYKG